MAIARPQANRTALSGDRRARRGDRGAPLADSTGVPSPLALLSQADSLSRRLPALLIEVDQVAASIAQGVHGRRRVGIGETFWQYRPYAAGDSLAQVDWRQSAKGDRVFIRQTEWEAAQSVWLWRDASASMDWASDRALPTKRQRATVLLLAATDLLIRGGEQVALLGTGERPARGRPTLYRIAQTLLQSAESDKTIPEPERGQRPLPAHAHVVLISDFLDDLDSIAAAIRRFSARSLRGLLVQVLDPAEEDLPYDGRVEFEGLEGEGRYLIPKVQDLRERYRRRLVAQREGLSDIVRRVGWTMISHRTDQPPQLALLALYRALARVDR